MLRQIMLNKQLEGLRKDLEALLTEQEDITIRAKALEDAIKESDSVEDMDAVAEEVEKIEAEKEELEEKKSKLEGEIAEVEAELERLNSKAPTNKKRKKVLDMPKEDRFKGLELYIRSKGQIRETPEPDDPYVFTTEEGGKLVPTELLTPEKALEDKVDLTKLVRVRKVNSGGGKYPIIKKSGGVMVSVEELAKNPDLAVPEINDITYSISTYRGYIPVSQELIDDADYDVVGLIAEEIQDQELRTKNNAIATILKTATAKSVSGLDGLKEIFNVSLKRVYSPKAIISASLFNELDTTKDKTGRYLLQDDITVSSGKRLFGHEVIILDDDVIGTSAGDLKGFIGDTKEFATLFDRKRSSVKWVDNDIYGQLLAGYVRFDVKRVDSNAGFYITFNTEAELNILGVTTEAGTAKGDSKITVTGTGEGNTLAFKVGESAIPVSYGQKAVGWTNFESGKDTEVGHTNNGKVITVVELNASRQIVGVRSEALVVNVA